LAAHQVIHRKPAQVNPDDAAWALVDEYAALGLCAFVIRARQDRRAYYIGPEFPRETVRQMLLAAAEAYKGDDVETLQ
jgi:hypothetical protein